ncbi:MAG: DNA repair protein RecN [Candidatus Delongbacteria bacterium]|nr:DNA repair protein RecN [Candidatus Delongbacteria bacterium]
MLTNLRLTNYFYSDSLEIAFAPGLNIITGATGSGKSVLVAAIEAALGSRRLLAAADSSRKSIMECEFQADHLNPLLAAEDLELLPTLQVRREIRPDHSSRFFINDTPVRMKLVRQLGSRLVDFHAQNDLSLLLHKKYHTAYVDSFEGAGGARTAYDLAWQAWRETARHLKELEAKLLQQLEQRELHQFQLRELQAAQLLPDEDTELQQAEQLLTNAETILHDIAQVRQILDGEDDSVRTSLYQVQKALERIVSQSNLGAEALQTLREAVIGVDDVSQQVSVLADRVEHRPERLEEIRQRLELIGGLKRKYGPTLAQVLQRQAVLETDRLDLQELQQQSAQLATRKEQQQAELLQAADRLSHTRHLTGEQIARQVNPLLRELGIEGSGLEVRLVPRVELPHADGSEQCEFRIATNPGMSAEPLEEVASGGELSRVMLALKSISADFEPQNVLVFDEIDRGVSGKAAVAVGKRLQALAQTRQVICITHLPQIAALANHHLAVIKDTTDSLTRIRVEPLDRQRRIEELALLVGGTEVSPTDREYARKLLSPNVVK